MIDFFILLLTHFCKLR